MSHEVYLKWVIEICIIFSEVNLASGQHEGVATQ